jgi:hypothetical protein
MLLFDIYLLIVLEEDSSRNNSVHTLWLLTKELLHDNDNIHSQETSL